MRRQRTLYPPMIYSRYAAALLACVTLLQFPLPLLHSHESFDSPATLAAHVSTRHAIASPVAGELHWHFVSPRELNQEEGSEEDSDLPEVCFVCLAASGSASATGKDITANLLGGTLLHSAPIAGNIISPVCGASELFQPFPSLRPPVRLCALLCVVRC